MTTKYQVKPFDNEMISQIYKTEMVHDFPEAELKPLPVIHSLVEREEYLCLGFYRENDLCGYAYLCRSSEVPYLLLDYLAILRPYRNQGLGGAFLECLLDSYGNLARGIVLEVESPLAADNEADRALRARRIGFYLRNGSRQTKIISSLKKVDYQIMYLPLHSENDEDDEALLRGVDQLYRVLYPQPLYDEYFDYLRLSPKNENNEDGK